MYHAISDDLPMLLAAEDGIWSSTVAGRGFPDFWLDGALALMRICWRFKMSRVDGRWSICSLQFLALLLAAVDGRCSSTVAVSGFPDFWLDGALALMHICWRFKISRVEGRWLICIMKFTIICRCSLQWKTSYMFFNRRLKGVSEFLIGRCSSNDAYLFAI